ncbi:hypothetical protein Acr_17g0013530 [Actinidia rufa]|uniref:Pectinesterase inhibitor domain-containing protein n=1 Tax=Actinidia rufa TaxID=165716 RepID=A0A7J0G4R5_9ERIC|nr:hypothetical protein Acr_17g0013530 [Actinidia rufa]
MATIQYCILSLALSLLIFWQAAEANESWLVKSECHNAMVPATCMKCLDTDHRTAGAVNAAGVATIVIGCVSKNADNLSGEMSQLAASSHDKGLVKALKDCCKLLDHSKKELAAACQKIDKGDFDGADHSVYSVFNYGVQCHSELDEAVKSSKVDVSPKVMSELKVHEQLCEAAMRMIDRLK